jgi:plasmid stabilization system protein ParE
VKYSFLADAETEYLEAIRFYEQQQSNLGASLIHEFERAMVLIVKKPEIYRLVHPAGIRRISLDRFPYSVFYRISADHILITAFAHHRRRPDYWLTRIK